MVEIENVVYLKTIGDGPISGKFWTPRILRTTPLGPLKFFYFSDFRPPSGILSEMKNVVLQMSKSLLNSQIFNLEVCHKICYPYDTKDYSSNVE